MDCRTNSSSTASPTGAANDPAIDKTILARVVDSYRRIRNTLRFLLANIGDFEATRHTVTDADLLDWMFRRDLEAGHIESPLDVADVWPSSYSANTNEILWAARLLPFRKRSTLADEEVEQAALRADFANLEAPAWGRFGGVLGNTTVNIFRCHGRSLMSHSPRKQPFDG